jgi:hypothetical protein
MTAGKGVGGAVAGRVGEATKAMKHLAGMVTNVFGAAQLIEKGVEAIFSIKNSNRTIDEK